MHALTMAHDVDDQQVSNDGENRYETVGKGK